MSNYPTLDGLNSIDVDNGNLTNITCETFIATTSAQVPTMIAGDNSTNVANTEFVTDAVSTATANLVTLDTTQTLTTGVKTFTNLPQSSATVSNNADLTNKKYVDDNFINIIGNQTLTTGVKTFTVLPQSSATPSSNTDLTTKKYVDDNFVGLTGNQTISSGSIKTFITLPQSTATPINNADLTNKSYVDNLVGGLTGSYVGLTGNQTISSVKTFVSLPQSTAVPSVNADLTNKLYVDNLFSGATGSTGGAFVTLTGAQTLGSGVKTFTDLPSCTAVPINNADLTNKLYVDNLFSGATGAGVFVTLTGTQTLGSGIKTFTDLPRCAATPSDYRELVNKDYVDNRIGGLTGTYIGLTGAQTVGAGIKTFTDLPRCAAVPSVNTDLTNKLYVDNLVSGITGSFVTLGGNQVLTAGIKTFTDLPECTAVPSNNANLTNKKYVDDNFINIVGNQTLTTGIKTFTNLPQSTGVPSVNADLTNKLYVDNAVAAVVGGTGTFVTLGTSQTLTTGIKTFTNLPQSTAVPTANADLTNKSYVDNNFLKLSGAQTVTGNKTFTGNNIIEGATGTNIIRGNQVDIYPTVTFLTSPTTTISGTNANIVSTTSYIGGTTNYLAATNTIVNNTVNSFYIDASYNNFVGKETYINTPYFLINTNCLNFVNQAAQTIIKSPYVAFTSDCTSLNINATNTIITGNTDMTGSVVTATTQVSSDNSTKVATTAFVNAHVLSSYMTTNTNQSIPTAIKTYGGKQVFNAGTACNTYDATGITDMTLASNNGDKGILTIAGGRIITDTYGVTLATNNRNLQLGDGTFIQPINQDGLNDYSKPTFVFSSNRTQGYTDITGVPNSAQATRQINILQGISSWFAGYNQTTTFTITHSIITTSTAIASMNEAEVVIYFQDFNTGIVRYTSPNLATTTAFALPANSTVIRPVITFTLTTAQLPEGEYLIMGYSRVTNAYAVNTGVLTVNFSYAGATSTDTSVQNYNTPTPSTFTSRNLYHIFRNTAMCGVFLLNSVTGSQHIPTPIHYSISDFNNMMFQPTTSGAVSTPAITGGSAVGNFSGLAVDNADNRYLVYPNYSLIVYDNTGWSGTVYINFKNTTSNPVCIAPTTTQRGSSCRIYFDEVELIKY